MQTLLLFSLCVTIASSLRCYEGSVKLDSNWKTPEKECGGVSSYCLQTIDKASGEMRRSCSSFRDEHNMEERCPMTGCHWQSSKETFCCCQFDLCNEWKSDGTEFGTGEMTTLGAATKNTSAATTKPRPSEVPVYPATPKPTQRTRKTSTVEID